MDILNNIIAMPKAGSAKPHKAQGNDASAQKIFGFLKLLSTDKGKAAQGEGIAAKLSRLLEKSPEKAQELQKILDGAGPGTKDETIKQIMALLDEPQAPQAALTSDLAAGLSILLQGETDEGAIIDALEAQFAALGSDITNEDIEAFRDEAIDYLKGLGLSDGDIESILVKFSLAHDTAMTQEQAAQLMMPVPPQEEAPPAKLAAQQPVQATAEQDIKANMHNMKGDTAADTGATPKQAAPQGQTATSHVSLVGALAADDGGFSQSGFGGQSFGQQQGNPFGAPLQGMGMANAASAESFVNHMSNTAQTPTTQMLALQIQRNAQAQITTFNMQLNPADLGRLEVKLRFMRDGTLKAHITADRADTLSTLQKDSPQLHRILEQAGLNMDENALSFDLRQQQHEGTQQSYNDNGAPATGGGDVIDNALQAKIAVEAAGYIRQDGVNIVV